LLLLQLFVFPFYPGMEIDQKILSTLCRCSATELHSQPN
jgi:hypothetical protein